MNVLTTIKNLNGKGYQKSGVTQDDLDDLPKIEKNGEEIPDIKKLPRESFENIILLCLSNYVSSNNLDKFKIINISNKILNADGNGDVEFKEKEEKFLVKVLKKSEIKEVDGKPEEQTGIYKGWVLVPILLALGETGEE